MTKNPYAKIKQNSIMTAAPHDLTLMLYDGAIKFINQAKEAINERDIELANIKILKVQDIILEFKSTLNRKYAIAKDFEVMYDYMLERLLEANLKKDIEILDEVLSLTREFRDTWKQAIDISKGRIL